MADKKKSKRKDSKKKDSKKKDKDKSPGKTKALTAAKPGKKSRLSELMGGTAGSAVIGAIAAEVAQVLVSRSTRTDSDSHGVADTTQSMKDSVQGAVGAVKDAVEEVAPSVANAIDVVKTAVADVKPSVANAADELKTVTQNAAQTANAFVPASMSGAIDRVTKGNKPAKKSSKDKKK